MMVNLFAAGRRGLARLACAPLMITMLAAIAVSPLGGLSAAASDRVSFNMSWLPQGSVGGVLVAKAKGFYTDEGLDVAVSRGYGAQRTVNEIDQHLFDIGYGDPISVILNRANGGETLLVGAINTRWPAGLCYIQRADRTIAKIQDLKGLSLAGNATSPLQRIVPAWLTLNGLPKTYVKLLQMDPAVYNAALLSGGIDLSECWEGSSRGLLSVLASREGKTIGWINYRDFGLDAYGSGFVTSAKMTRERPDVLRRFLKASYRGYAEMAQHSDEAVGLILKQFPTLDPEILKAQIAETNVVTIDPQVADKGLGWMREDRMKTTLNFVEAAFALKDPVTLQNLYTDEFLK